MEASNNTGAPQALSELLEVSPQVQAAAIVERDGTPLAWSFEGGTSPDAAAVSTDASDERARSLGSAATRLLEQTEQSRVELGREPVTQCEVATGDGSVFVVADDERIALAITGSEPTVGLVFYDLKTALRTVREQSGNATGETTSEREGAEA